MVDAVSQLEIIKIILVIIIAAVLGIIYSLRILVLMERRIARVDSNLEKLVKAVMKEEKEIEKKEDKILKKLGKKKK